MPPPSPPPTPPPEPTASARAAPGALACPPPPLSERVAAAFNLAGGAWWHLEAWRSGRRWAGFRQRLGGWLGGWRPSERRLLLVGPSAGWLLPREALGRFEAIAAIDPDPLAPWLFRRRFRGLPVTFSARDYLGPRADPLRPEGLDRLFGDHPGHAVLFCNVLSQLGGLYPAAVGAVADPPADTARFLAWKAHLRTHLGQRSWASFHDRLTCRAPPAQDVVALERELPVLELAARVFRPGPGAGDGAGPPLEVTDHQLAGLAPELPRHLLHWPRRPRLHHVVELLSEAR
jgi:hypothetical protein